MKSKNYLTFVYLTVFLVLSVLLILSYLFSENNIQSNIENDSIETPYELAIFSGNSNECLNLEEDRERNTCLALYDACDNDECYKIHGIQTLDTRSCNNIEDQSLRVSCNAEINNRVLLQKSVEQRNVEICNEFSSQQLVDSCKDSYYFTVSNIDNDLSLCRNINNRGIRNECLKN